MIEEEVCEVFIPEPLIESGKVHFFITFFFGFWFLFVYLVLLQFGENVQNIFFFFGGVGL